MRQDITLEILLFIFCNPTDNFAVGVDGWDLMLCAFGEAECSSPLDILATTVATTTLPVGRELTDSMTASIRNLRVVL